MITIMPIDPEVLPALAEEINVTADGPVWGYIASDGKTMLGYIMVEKQEPVRIIALQTEDPSVADGLLRRALFPLHEEGSRGYIFQCEVKLVLPMAYTRRGEGSLAALFDAKCPGCS